MTNSMTSVIELATVENTICHFPGNPLRAETRIKMRRTVAATTAALALEVSSPTQCSTRLKSCGIGDCSTNSPLASNAFEKDASTSFAELCKLRSEEHTSELQSLRHLVCRLL